MKQTTLRIITGLTILAGGIGALLGSLNIIPFWSWFGDWWPLLILLTAVIVMVSNFSKNYIWGIALLVIGSFLLLRTQGVVDFSIFSLIIPVIIIAIGLSVLANTSNRAKIPTGTQDTDDIVAIFGGSEMKNQSQNYKGGKVTAIFGGVMLDLRDATIKGEANLDIFTLCGGVELKVPRDWHVVNKTIPVAGGIENKAEGKADGKGPVLILTGTVALGGVEVKT